MRTEMMTFTPANRKFFTQLIGQKANKNENKTNSILGVVWAKRKKRDRRGIWSRQAIKSKSSARSSPERRQHLNFYKLIADVPSAQFPRLIGAVIVYCILVQCFFFVFLFSLLFFVIYFLWYVVLQHPLPVENSVPVTEKNWFCRLFSHADAFGDFWGSESPRYSYSHNWAPATSLLIDLARNISRSRRLNLSVFCGFFGNGTNRLLL